MNILLLLKKELNFFLVFLSFFLSISLCAADIGDYGQVIGRYDSNEILPVYMGNGIDIQDVAFCVDINSEVPQVGDYYTVINDPTAIPNKDNISAVLNAIYDGYELYPDVQQAIWYFSNPGYNPPSSGANTIINLVNNGTYQPLADVAWLDPDNNTRQVLVGANRAACTYDLSNVTLTMVDPTGCTPTYDGQVVFNNLEPNGSYSLTYIDEGVNVGPIAFTADGSGSYTLGGLDPGNYNNFEITSTTEALCFQCFIQPNGYDLMYTEMSACPIAGPTATTLSTSALMPSSATSVNCESIAATWSNPLNALDNDGLNASVTLSQALLGVRASHCLELTGFNFNVPDCAVITGVSMTLGGSSSVDNAEDRIIRLLSGGSYLGSNQAQGTWPTSGTLAYGGTTDTWGSTLTPAMVNSSDFGTIIKVGIDLQLFNNADVFVNVDYVEMTVHYSLPEVCAEEKVPFSVAASPDVVSYTWTAPAGSIIESGEGTNAIVIDMNNIAEGCYDVCVETEFVCTGIETCCYTVSVMDCCPELTSVTDTGADACYTGTAIDVTYTATVDAGTNGAEYTMVWYVDGVAQTGVTTDQFVLSLSPVDGCTVLASPTVTAQLYCTEINDIIGTPMESSSASYNIYPTPVEGVDFTVVESDCNVSIVDNCGTLDITNDQGTGSTFTLNSGDSDQVVNFAIRSDINAPVGCETTLNRTVACTKYDLALVKSVDNPAPGFCDTIVYTIMVYNEGTNDMTGIQVADYLPTSLTYVEGITSVGTFDGIIWDLGSLAVGDSASLQIVAGVSDYGVIFNTAEVIAANEIDIDSTPNNADALEDDISSVCISVPYEECISVPFSYTLEAPAGYTSYQWYLDGVLIDGETGQTYIATAPGSYNYVVDENIPGSCKGELCCPVVITTIDCCPDPQCIRLTVTKK